MAILVQGLSLEVPHLDREMPADLSYRVAKVADTGSRATLHALTTFRLIAALVVVVFHARGTLLPTALTVPGGEAVSFFFVLSGFILTYTYYLRSYSLKDFYAARLARIFPACILSILACFLLLNPMATGQSPTPLITASNLLLVQSMIPIPAYYFALNAVLWSVSVEVFFYLLFPALENSLHSRAGRLVLIAGSLLAGCMMVGFAASHDFPEFSATSYYQTTWHGLVYINPLSRLKEFVIGMLAGAAMVRSQNSMNRRGCSRILFTVLEILAIFLLVWSFPQISSQSMKIAIQISSAPTIAALYISQTLTALIFAITILIFAASKGWISRILANRTLMIGGEISFSIYLFHQILIIWQYKNPWLLGWCPESYRFAVYLATIVLVSYAIWRWFECPMRRLIRQGLAGR